MAFTVIRMPDIGEGIAEVELVAWHVAAGDAVAEDQTLCRRDDRQGHGRDAVAGGRQGAGAGRPVGQVMAVGSELIRMEVEGERRFEANAAPRAGRCCGTRSAAVPAAAPPARARGATCGPPPPAAAPTDAPPPACRARRTSARWPRPRCAAAPATWASSCATCRQRPGRPHHCTTTWTPTWPVRRQAPGRGRFALCAAAPWRGARSPSSACAARSRRRCRRPSADPALHLCGGGRRDRAGGLRQQLNRSTAVPRAASSRCCPSWRAPSCWRCADFPQVNARFDDEAGVVTRHAPCTWAWPRRPTAA
jgi:hypothetical protein